MNHIRLKRDEVAAARRSGGDFAINGRFLTQPVTGVQRYARELLAALPAVMADWYGTATVYAPAKALDAPTEAIGPVTQAIEAPSGVIDAPMKASLRVVRTPGKSGHRWEQLTLPRHSGTMPLLNLCNTAPLLARSQIVCLHDTNVFNAPGSYTLAFRLFYKAMQPLIVRGGAIITTVSSNAARDIAKFLSVPYRQITILPNGHEHALRWDPSRSDLGASWTTDRPFVLLLGSLARHKNINRILGLADALDAMNIELVVAGGIAKIFASERKTTAGNIRWLGRVSDDDLAFLMQRALCLAFPSLNEGFGLPLVEAMAWNCPIVANRRSSIPEVCRDAALYVEADDDQQWLQHFRTLLASRDCGDELRGRGRAQLKRFSWQKSARGYLDLLASR